MKSLHFQPLKLDHPIKGVANGGGVGGVIPPPPTPTLLKFVGILTKCVGKFSWPNVIGKFGVLYHKKRNAEFYQRPVPQKSNFYWWWRLWKKLYKICTDNYDNNEYLAVKYIRFFTNDIVWCLQCNVYQWAKKITWKWSYNTDVKSLVKQN